MKYILMRDRYELKATTAPENIIDEYFGYFGCGINPEEIAVYTDRKTALEALEKYHCTSYVQSTFAGKARICEFYFITERDDDDDTGIYDFAEIQL